MSVFHLKYRPQKIADLDSVVVAGTLTKILKLETIPQAFLFTGPEGAGKTSAARILAKAINCLARDGVEPCGKCDNCREIGSGAAIDVLEIDAASNRGIDDARSLRERAILLPSKLKTKIFIIDEVHMLTKEAFNALLKLIEEPPGHTVFILCTTDATKIPETVLSRLTRIDFPKGGKKELVRALDKIVEGEKLEMGAEVIEWLIERSDGSFRNIQRLLNEIFIEFGQKINLGDVIDFWGRRGGNYGEREIELDLVAGKTSDILERLEKEAEKGADFADLRTRLILYFQKKLLSFYGLGETEEGLNKEDTEKLLKLLIEAGKWEKMVDIGQLPIELVVIDFLAGKSFKPDSSKLNSSKPEKPEEPEKPEIPKSVELAKVEEEWGNILRTVKPFNHSVEAFLRAARPKQFLGQVLTIEVFYPFHKEKLEEERNRIVVEKALETVLGMKVELKCQLGESKKPPLVVKNETPIAQVVSENKDIYDVAKEIFG